MSFMQQKMFNIESKASYKPIFQLDKIYQISIINTRQSFLKSEADFINEYLNV